MERLDIRPVFLIASVNELSKYRRLYPDLVDDVDIAYAHMPRTWQGLSPMRVFVAESVPEDWESFKTFANLLVGRKGADPYPIILRGPQESEMTNQDKAARWRELNDIRRAKLDVIRTTPARMTS